MAKKVSAAAADAALEAALDDRFGPVEQISSVNLIECISTSLSQDKQHLMIVFTVGDPNDEKTHRKFGLTLAAVQAKWLTGVAYSAVNIVEKAGANPGNSVMHFPFAYRVAHAPELDAAEFRLPETGAVFEAGKGKAIVGFDQGGPSEINFVLMNVPAMALAAAIRQDVGPRLTEPEKAELRAKKVPL